MVIFHKSMTGVSKLMLVRFIVRARRAAGLRGSVNVLVTSNAEMTSLNRRFRGKDKATDVLSFPAARDVAKEFAGDIAISADIATQSATSLGHAPAVEVKILTLHGILHLRGYDHERDNGKMARREQELRRELKLPVGLIERAESLAAGPAPRPKARTEA